MNTQSSKIHTNANTWEALTYYNLYRFLISFLFVALYWIGQLPEPLGIYDRNIFALSAHFYLFISIVAFIFIQIKKPRFNYQVTIQIILEILIINVFIYSSAGLNSGFGMLHIISIAGGSLLIPGRIGFLFAAIAALSVLGHEVYLQFSLFRASPNYIHAGFLGIIYFLTAMISHILASRIEKTEALAEKQAIDLENLARLNEHIVQRLHSGIIVFDEELKIRLANESASNLLGIHGRIVDEDLEKHFPQLIPSIMDWMNNSGLSSLILKPESGHTELQVSIVKIFMENKSEILVFLDDVSRLRQHAQKLKLASLGRLTASIAHEVRNPLGAISHAAQLLNESIEVESEEKRLLSIITEQSVRVNSIIENVLKISRRERSVSSPVNLFNWLDNFVQEMITRKSLNKDDIRIDCKDKELKANIDIGQLFQVMWNVCENGLRYSNYSPYLVLRCDVHHDTSRPYIDIIDCGNGINNDLAENLFEPFFTTEKTGTGLGLFIARELCEANQASLILHKNDEKGCIFRINFAYPDKRQEFF